MKSKRIEWIDFGKGVTILMVVLGHVVLGLFESRKFENSNTVLLFLTQVFYLFHIPVFYALSGFFFKPVVDLKKFWNYFKQKTIILGVPYLFYSVLQFILQTIGGESVRNAASLADLLQIYKTPLGVSWYLYVLWWIYLVVGLISIKVKSYNQLFLISLFAYILSLFFPVNIYIIQKVLLWSFFFIFGYWLKKSGLTMFLQEQWKWITSLSIGVIVMFLIFWQQSSPSFYISYDTPGLWGLIFSVSVVLAFTCYPILNTFKRFGTYFSKIGKNSLVIYLLHAPIVSITRITLLKLNISNIYVHLILGLLLGWYGSLFILYLIKKVSYIDFVFYPMKYLKKKTE